MKEKNISAYLTGIFIALAGIGLLIFVIYYMFYFPVPEPMHPLRSRIFTALKLEEARKEATLRDQDFRLEVILDMIERGQEEERDVSVEIKSNLKEVDIFQEPNLDSEIIFKVKPESSLVLLQLEGTWCKISLEGKEGWIEEDKINLINKLD